MQKLICIVKTVSTLGATLTSRSASILPNVLGSFQSATESRLLTPSTPMVTPICSLKIKGRVRRRCAACYFVVRDERLYVMCPKFPRHKQVVMKQKPINTWILTHATQGKVRPW